MGAAALTTDRDVMRRLNAYINLDSIGAAGPPMLFESGSGQRLAAVRRGRRAAPHPRGGSFAGRDLPAAPERYRLLDPQAPGHSRPEFRRRRRQLRLSHRARHARTPPAGHAATDGRTRRRARHRARRRRHHAAILRGPHLLRRRPGDRPSAYGPYVGSWIAFAALSLGVVAWVKVIGRGGADRTGFCAGC